MSRLTQQGHGSRVEGSVIPDKKKMLNPKGTSHSVLRNTTEMLEVLGLISAPVNSSKTLFKIYNLRGMNCFKWKHLNEKPNVATQVRLLGIGQGPNMLCS